MASVHLAPDDLDDHSLHSILDGYITALGLNGDDVDKSTVLSSTPFGSPLDKNTPNFHVQATSPKPGNVEASSFAPRNSASAVPPPATSVQEQIFAALPSSSIRAASAHNTQPISRSASKVAWETPHTFSVSSTRSSLDGTRAQTASQQSYIAPHTSSSHNHAAAAAAVRSDAYHRILEQGSLHNATQPNDFARASSGVVRELLERANSAVSSASRKGRAGSSHPALSRTASLREGPHTSSQPLKPNSARSYAPSSARATKGRDSSPAWLLHSSRHALPTRVSSSSARAGPRGGTFAFAAPTASSRAHTPASSAKTRPKRHSSSPKTRSKTSTGSAISGHSHHHHPHHHQSRVRASSSSSGHRAPAPPPTVVSGMSSSSRAALQETLREGWKRRLEQHAAVHSLSGRDAKSHGDGDSSQHEEAMRGVRGGLEAAQRAMEEAADEEVAASMERSRGEGEGGERGGVPVEQDGFEASQMIQQRLGADILRLQEELDAMEQSFVGGSVNDELSRRHWHANAPEGSMSSAGSRRSSGSLGLGASTKGNKSVTPITLKTGSVQGKLKRALRDNARLRRKLNDTEISLSKQCDEVADLTKKLSTSHAQVEELAVAARMSERLRASLAESEAIRERQALYIRDLKRQAKEVQRRH